MCLIGIMQLLCMQCRGIGPHLVARGKSHGFLELRGCEVLYSAYDVTQKLGVMTCKSGCETF